MWNLKIISAIIIILTSSATFSETSAPILSKFTKQNWEFGGKAIYFHPNITADSTVNLSFGSLESNAFSKSPQWGFGFMLESSYNFSAKNNINLNWYHLTSNLNSNLNSSRTINIPSNFNISLIDTFENNLSAATLNNTKYNISPTWDMINLEFGKNISFSQYNAIRLHAGFEYARLSSNNSLSIIGSTTINNITTQFNSTIANNDSYYGFGPRLGVDMNAISEKNFEFYAKGAMALLTGKNKHNYTTTNHLLSISRIINNSTTSVVPEIDGKLGIDYVYNLTKSKLILDCGWMWINYFNAVIRQENSDLNSTSNSYDFGLNGIYWGVKWLA